MGKVEYVRGKRRRFVEVFVGAVWWGKVGREYGQCDPPPQS
jgi:hypothetical protein